MVQGLAMYQDHPIVPPSLRAEILDTLHSGQQGATSMVARASNSVWWLNMNDDIRTMRAEYMANLQVVSEYNSHMFHPLPHTLRRQLLKGKSGFDGRSTAHAQSGHEAKLRRICLKTGSEQ